MFNKKTDDQLMEMIANENYKAFEVLFNRYASLVFGYSRKFFNDPIVAEDMAQDVWQKLIVYSKNYQAQGAFKSWLMRMTKNICINNYNRKFNKLEFREDFNDEVDDGSEISQILEDKERYEDLEVALGQLPDNQRIILMLWFVEEKNYKEISEDLGLSLSAVKSNLFRAKKSLAKEVSKNEKAG
ncbi:sigma-70 family RNA polymerase sigma factor [bacterium]|nr:sigma-70 family RNA polymerase sigma factor [bacterium]